jgi:adenosine deaminase
VVESLAAHPLPRLLRAGVCVTVNSDDPPYFGGWATENLLACHREMGLSRDEIVRIARNGLHAAFMPDQARSALLRRLDEYVAAFGNP